MSLESSGDRYIFSMLRLLCFLRLFLSDCPCEITSGESVYPADAKVYQQTQNNF